MIVSPTTPLQKLAIRISIPLWDDCEKYVNGKYITLTEFQFHYGMIVRSLPFTYICFIIKISIPLWDDCEKNTNWNYLLTKWNFNSTMGWLWGDTPHLSTLAPRWFQFHYGMIVRDAPLVIARLIIDFNSTMGWLWETYIWYFTGGLKWFQFHYGMIVRVKVATSPTVLTNFNSTMGWLWVNTES